MPIKTAIPSIKDGFGNTIVPGDLVVYGTKFGKTRVGRVKAIYSYKRNNRWRPEKETVTRMSVQSVNVYHGMDIRPIWSRTSTLQKLGRVVKIASTFVPLDVLAAINK